MRLANVKYPNSATVLGFFFLFLPTLMVATTYFRAMAQNFEVSPIDDNDEIPGAQETLLLYDGPRAAFGKFKDGGIFNQEAEGWLLSTGKATDAARPCAYVPGVPVAGAPHDFAQLRVEFIPMGDTLELFLAAATHEFPDRFPGGPLFMNTPDVYSIALSFDGQTQTFSPQWQWTANTGPFNPAFQTLNFSAYSSPETMRVQVPVGKRCVLTFGVRDGGDPWVDSALFVWGLRISHVYSIKYEGRLEVFPATLCTSTPFEVRPRPQINNYFYDWRTSGPTFAGNLSDGGKRFVAALTGVYLIEADVYENLGAGIRYVATLKTEAVVYPGPEGAISGPGMGCAGEAMSFGLQYDYAANAEWDFGAAATPRSYSGFYPPQVVFNESGNHNVSVRLFNDRCETTIVHTVRIFSRPPPPQNAEVCYGQTYKFVLPPGYDYVWKKENGRTVGRRNIFEVGPVFADSGYVLETKNGACVRRDSLWARVRLPRPATFHYSFTDAYSVEFVYPHTPAPVRWLWDFGDGTFADERRPQKNYFPGTYLVQLVTLDSLGCRDTFSTTIRVGEWAVVVPDAFTPNSDDVNREFRIFARELDDFQFTVYNRYGTVVFATRDANFLWPGNDPEGKPLPEGVYAYRMTAVTRDRRPIHRTGTLTVIR